MGNLSLLNTRPHLPVTCSPLSLTWRDAPSISSHGSPAPPLCSSRRNTQVPVEAEQGKVRSSKQPRAGGCFREGSLGGRESKESRENRENCSLRAGRESVPTLSPPRRPLGKGTVCGRESSLVDWRPSASQQGVQAVSSLESGGLGLNSP